MEDQEMSSDDAFVEKNIPNLDEISSSIRSELDLK
jgi:hypothetical protein